MTSAADPYLFGTVAAISALNLIWGLRTKAMPFSGWSGPVTANRATGPIGFWVYALVQLLITLVSVSCAIS